MLTQRPGESGALNFNHMQENAMNLVENLCGAVCLSLIHI